MASKTPATPVDEATAIAAAEGKRPSDIDSAAELVETLLPGASHTVANLREIAARLRGEPVAPQPGPYAEPGPPLTLPSS